jgi:hypothetical protein
MPDSGCAIALHFHNYVSIVLIGCISRVHEEIAVDGQGSNLAAAEHRHETQADASFVQSTGEGAVSGA